MRSCLFEELSWPEIAASVEAEYVPILPTGATEQHGPHLPTCTDTLLPLEIAKQVSAQARVLVLPAQVYGCRSKARTGGGQGFPGTISLDGATFIKVIRDVVGEVARHGFQRLIVFSWHYENTNFVHEGI